jgi:polyisoprenoid-binding protein YceI
MSPDFFDAASFPEVNFSTDQAKVEGNEVTFEGELTIKGITQPATLTGTVTGPIADPYGNERYGLELQTTIDRTQFGITWNNDMPNGTKALADEVTLKADLSLVKAA